MGKLINTDELLKQMLGAKEIGMKMFKFKETGANPVEVVADAMIDCVLDATAVDAVEVVRCFECKHLNHCVIKPTLPHADNLNHFCAWGEREEREQDESD